MTRATVIAAVRDYLSASYHGPVAIHPESSTETIQPPYTVIRIGSGEQMYPGQAEIWDMNILIGVFHDADTTTAEDAEAQAGEVFAMFDDPAGFFTASAETLVWSAFERHVTEASIAETRWQHVAGFRGIVAPAAED
jgi:hypothetical protein